MSDLIERARSEVDLRKRMHGDDRSNWSRADRMMEELLTALEAAREDAEEVARWRFVRTLGKLPVRCSTGYYYEDGVLHPTLNEAIDQARGKGVDAAADWRPSRHQQAESSEDPCTL